MEEIRRAAEAYYENLPEGKKTYASFKFKQMDKNGDGQIDLYEYAEYLDKDNNMALTHPRMFRALDKNNDGGLDFEEAKVLYYITENKRALFCKICNTFLTDVYFSCSQCFFKGKSVSTYEICCGCYAGKKFTHHEHAIFCDNYSLLSQSRSLATPPKDGSNLAPVYESEACCHQAAPCMCFFYCNAGTGGIVNSSGDYCL
ncbi:calcium-dependent protein [Salix suchowensis]|nr:calcium-dependent protein [Salix suchowensis]